MANRLQDYGFVGYDGKILDTPDRIASYLSQWAQKNPGYTYVAGQNGATAFKPPSMAMPANIVPGTMQETIWRAKQTQPGIKSGADNFAGYFFAGNPELYANPAAISTAIQNSPETGTALMDYINASAAAGRARDSGNIFGKAFNTLSTFGSIASGLGGLTAGLGALTTGAGLVNAAKTGAAFASGLPNQLKAAFFPAGNALTAAGNAVPGIRTGVTTPAGGGALTGSGQAAKLTGLQGGAPLGASPLAVAGGAQAANLFPRFPGLGQVQALPSGRLPGTNVNVGQAPGKAASVGLGDLLDVADMLNSFRGGSRITPTTRAARTTGNALAQTPAARQSINPLRSVGRGIDYAEPGIELFADDVLRGARGGAFQSTDPRDYYILNRTLGMV